MHVWGGVGVIQDCVIGDLSRLYVLGLCTHVWGGADVIQDEDTGT